jgi:hypothetical protein
MKIYGPGIGILLVCLVLVGPVCGAYPSEDYSKVLILHLNFSKEGVNEQSVDMQYGHPPILGLQTGDIHGVLKTSDGDVITGFDLSDPRYQLGDGVVISGNGTNLSITGAASYSDTADFTLVMPYYPNQMTLDLSDKRTGSLLKSVNFSNAINRFRAMYPKDPGINPSQEFKIPLPVIQLPPKESPLYLEVGGGLIILLIIMFMVMIRKK